MVSVGRMPRISLWVVAYVLCSSLQIFRGSVGDTAVFLSGTSLILASTTVLEKYEFPSRRIVAKNQLEWAGLVLLISLAFTPRHSAFTFGLFVLLLPIVISLAWGEKAFPKVNLNKRDRNTRLMWSAWAIAVCLWEFAANILGQLSTDPNNFPTISVLVDPLLKNELGQAGFVAVWLSVGYGLLKSGAK